MLVDAGSAGHICDAVKKIGTDEAFARLLGSNARLTVEGSYSIESTVRRYMELYRELAES
jgi:hypothetical protein